MIILAGKPVTDVNLAAEGGKTYTYTYLIDCLDGQELVAEAAGETAVDDLVLEARRGTSGPYFSIEPPDTIDLSEWDGTQQTFQFRVSAEELASEVVRIFDLSVRNIPE